jgi:hypothetical protein
MEKTNSWVHEYLEYLSHNLETYQLKTPLTHSEDEATALWAINPDLYTKLWFLYKRVEIKADDALREIEQTFKTI